ncbi:MAG TPA: hypothetical protein VLM89_05455 [Phycisphaerae bacterium]|nr:hypothetical protein [Phycisphaerae bacterium]
MKTHITVIVVACAAALALAVSAFTAYPLESAETRLNRQIDKKVDTAQRMLLAYRPVATHLDHRLGAAATQPADIEPEVWQNSIGNIDQGPAGSQLRELGGQVRAMNERAGRLDGETLQPVPQVPGSTQAYQQLQDDLKLNEQLLSDALRITQEAIGLSEGEYSGSEHPGATRLEAVLCYHQADQLRRKAALYNSDADDAQVRFARDLTWWHRLTADITSTQRELGEAPAAASSPASTPASEPAVAETQAAALPAIDERIAALKQHRAGVAAEIEAAQAQAGQLTEAINKQKQRLVAASQQARDSQQQMLKLTQEGVDASDPQALQRFVEAYEKASAANRAAYREATTLEQGAVRNARVNTTDEDEVLIRPLAPVDPAGQMTTERGLIALEGDLKAAEALILGQQAVVKEIDRQIAELATRKKEMTERVDTLRKVQAQTAEQVLTSAKAAFAARLEALRLEQQGLEVAQGRGRQAAQRVKRAIENRINDARSRNAENSPESPNPRLVLISKDTISPGHALAFGGDMELVAGQILAQQAGNLEHHARLLTELERIGKPVDQSMLPQGATLESAPPEAIKADAAQAAAEKARADAIEACKAALDLYTQADTPLQQLWVLHANMAGAHHLMANLTTGDESIQHADNARIEYLRAMKGREERPEIPALQRAMASLATRPAR